MLNILVTGGPSDPSGSFSEAWRSQWKELTWDIAGAATSYTNEVLKYFAVGTATGAAAAEIESVVERFNLGIFVVPVLTFDLFNSVGDAQNAKSSITDALTKDFLRI